MSKIILDLCGGTGSWSLPYKEAGFDVRVITLPNYDVRHCIINDGDLIFQGNTGAVNQRVKLDGIYGILAAPPCTVFSKAAWSIKKKDRKFSEGMQVVRACMGIIWTVQENGAPLQFWALENPMGYLNRFLGKPPLYFQPWQFGERGFLATKRTYIWGYFNQPAKTVLNRSIPFISPHSSKRDAVDKQRENKAWYTASVEDRARTPQGFAQAFYRSNK